MYGIRRPIQWQFLNKINQGARLAGEVPYLILISMCSGTLNFCRSRDDDVMSGESADSSHHQDEQRCHRAFFQVQSHIWESNMKNTITRQQDYYTCTSTTGWY
jgi:hypothetical protein